MCTLTLVPSKNQLILTFSRDESPFRLTDPTEAHFIDGNKYVFPKDLQSGGTWIAASKNRVICLLNGAFQAHKRKSKYAKSRGLIVKEILFSRNMQNSVNHIDLHGVEPFRLVMINLEQGFQIHELVWDEKEKHLENLTVQQAQIRSSATLYNAEQASLREKWLTNWLQRPVETNLAAHMALFHLNRHHADQGINILMHRNLVQTTSVSQVVIESQKVVRFSYFDLMSKKKTFTELLL